MDFDRLEAQLIAPRRLSQRDSEHDGCTKPQREHRRPARGLGESSEEWHPRRRQSDSALIDEERYGATAAQRAWNAAHRFLVVHDRHADAMSRRREVSIEERIRHVSRHGVDGQATRREIRATQLPVAEMARDDDQSLSERHPLFDHAPAVHRLEQVDDLSRRVRRKNRRLHARATEVTVRRACDALDIRVGQMRQASAQLSFDDRATNREWCVSESPDSVTDLSGPRKAQTLQRRYRAAQRRILGAMGKARLNGGRCRHVVVHFVRSPADSTARSNPSIIAASGDSRCARVRPALPIAIRLSSPVRNAATLDAV